jgi:cytochrome P450
MSKRYPPGPFNWYTPIGLTWRHLLRLNVNPLKFLTKMGGYGDISFYRVLTLRAYVVNHPQLIREVLITKATSFRKWEHHMKAFRQGVGNGLLTSDGDDWLRQRRMIQKPFQMQRMQHYAEITCHYTQRMVDSWEDCQEVQIEHQMVLLGQDIMAKSLFDVEVVGEGEELSNAVRIASDAFARENFAAFTLPDWMPLEDKRQKRWALETVDRVVRKIIRERRESGEQKKDLLSQLLSAVDTEGDGHGLTDDEVRDQAVTIFTAGYHTTAVALSWVWYMLAQFPDVQAKVVQEVDEVLQDREATLDDVPRLKYLEMVVKETLRLYPPAWALFGRETIEDIELGGYKICKGAYLGIFPWITQRDERFFPDPLRFAPERFAPENIKQIDQFAYFPFGAGPHICIGKSFAMMEIPLVIATVLQKYEVELPPDQPTPRFDARVSLRAKGDIRVTFRQRTSSPVSEAMLT